MILYVKRMLRNPPIKTVRTNKLVQQGCRVHDRVQKSTEPWPLWLSWLERRPVNQEVRSPVRVYIPMNQLPFQRATPRTLAPRF